VDDNLERAIKSLKKKMRTPEATQLRKTEYPAPGQAGAGHSGAAA
jgi:hypothetical protein